MRFSMAELRDRALQPSMKPPRHGTGDQYLGSWPSALANFADEWWPFDNFWKAIASPIELGRSENANAARNAISVVSG